MKELRGLGARRRGTGWVGTYRNTSKRVDRVASLDVSFHDDFSSNFLGKGTVGAAEDGMESLDEVIGLPVAQALIVAVLDRAGHGCGGEEGREGESGELHFGKS